MGLILKFVFFMHDWEIFACSFIREKKDWDFAIWK